MKIQHRFTLYEEDIVAKAKTTYVPGMDWEDIAQELRIILWRKLPKYKKSKRCSEKTFAQRIMSNRIKDLIRSANRDKRFLSIFHISWDAIYEQAILFGEKATV